MIATALSAGGTLATAIYRVIWISQRLPPPREGWCEGVAPRVRSRGGSPNEGRSFSNA